MRNITNEECKLYNTHYCDLLNMKSCESCFANDPEQDQQVLDDLKVLEGLLPKEGVHALFTTDECVLCKRENKGKRAYYGMLDLGHQEPKRKKRSAIGLKVAAKMGSMVPIQLSTCKGCAKRILTLEYLPVLFPLIMGIIALALITVPSISAALLQLSGVMPLLIFVIVIGFSIAAALMVNKRLYKKYSEQTVLDPFEIPTLKEMRDNGWFVLTTTNGMPRIVFTKKRLQAGVCTGVPQESEEESSLPSDA